MSEQSKSSAADEGFRPIGQRRTADEVLLAPRPARERQAFTRTDPWRALRILGEFVEGFDSLSDVDTAVAIFGSARLKPDDPWYARAVETARRFGEANFAVITGGGPGIMEAANRGATEAKTLSIGLNIELPHEQHSNPYLSRGINFRYFFVRKTMFIKYSRAYIFFPGGFGTLDEMFEALTLIQTERIKNFPVVLMGRDFWRGLLEWLKDTLARERMISPNDLNLFHVTDDPEEAVHVVVEGVGRHLLEERSNG
ncbi:MAG TPA: TIGR00730 family Rossman fold protein [Gemmatimonadales bacterium]